MDFDTFKEEIIAYLPIDFYDEENNKYRDYLLEALEQNWENEKYQFCILATNMLFMSFLYKSFWFVINKDFETVKDFLIKNPTLKLDKIFDYGFVPEKNFIDYFGKVFDVPPSSTKIYKELIDDRDSCAHANGNIEFEKDDFEAQLQRYYKAITKFFNKHKEKLIFSFLKDYQEFLNKSFDTITTFTFFDNWCKNEKLSIKELQIIFSECLNTSISTTSSTIKRQPKIVTEILGESVISPEETEDLNLRKLSRILLKYYIYVKSNREIDYSLKSFEKEVNDLLKKEPYNFRMIINYLQNEMIYNHELIDNDFDNIINIHFETLDDSSDDMKDEQESDFFMQIFKGDNR